MSTLNNEQLDRLRQALIVNRESICPEWEDETTDGEVVSSRDLDLEATVEVIAPVIDEFIDPLQTELRSKSQKLDVAFSMLSPNQQRQFLERVRRL